MHLLKSSLVSTFLGLILTGAAPSANPAAEYQASTPATAAVVPVDVALGSLMTLGDEYLKRSPAI